MSARLSVGVSKKLGLPAYSSIGASCQLEVELESDPLNDPAGFQARAGEAFLTARLAVEAELARLQGEAGASTDVRDEIGEDHREVHTDRDMRAGHGRSIGPLPRPGKPATTNQVRAILSIARRQHADLDGLLCDHGVARPEELTLAEASRLIDQLKAAGTA